LWDRFLSCAQCCPFRLFISYRQSPRPTGPVHDPAIFRLLHRNFRTPPWTLSGSGCKIPPMILPVPAESKSNPTRGEAMNLSSGIRPRSILASMAMLLGVMVMTLLPAYGQQEVDPTWYDPWGAPKTVAVQAAQPRAVARRHQARVKAVSTTRVAGKARGTQTATRSRPS
jgi:hypothetical protein